MAYVSKSMLCFINILRWLLGVFFANRAIGLSRLAITIQKNPVHEAAVVQSNCTDFKHHLDVLNHKMTDSLSKTVKGGPCHGFDIHDLATLPKIRFPYLVGGDQPET